MLYLHVPKIKRLEIIGADNKENRQEGNIKMAEKITHKKSIFQELILFSIPLILSGIFQQAYSIVDAVIVGNIEGEIALGAIGGTGTITSFYIMAITGFTVGISVLAGQKYGAGELPFVRNTLYTFTVILGGIFVLVSFFGGSFSHPILTLIHTPQDTILLAEQYIRIIMIGVPFLAVFNVYSAVLRGIGDSKAPFYSVLISSGANVLLDILLVAIIRLGVTGAALATVISQGAMTVFIVVYAMKKHAVLAPAEGVKLFDMQTIKEGTRLGIPPMIQSLVTASGNLILQDFMNSFGTATVIAITTAYRVDSLTLLPVINLSSAISTLTAQSYGARDIERIKKIRNAGLVLMVIVSGALTALIIPFGSRFIALFGAGKEAVQIGHDFFVRLASFYLFFGIGCAMRGYLEGIGDVTYTSILGILMLAIRIIGSYALVSFTGNMVIAYAEGISWLIGLILYLIRIQMKKPDRVI